MSTEKQVTTAALKAALKQGAANGQSVKTLTSLLDTTERAVRELREELVDEGVCVCAHPKHGYFIAITPEEVAANYDWLRSRALHTLNLASKLRAAFAPSETGPTDPIEQLANEGIFV